MGAVIESDWTLLRSILNTLPDHIYAKDLQGRFTLVNMATAEFFGFDSPDQIVGKTDFDLFPRDVAAWFFEEERQLLQSGATWANREAAITDHLGRQRWIITNKVPLRDENATIIGLVGVNRDITDRKSIVEELRQANVALAGRERELLSALTDLRQSHEQLRSTQLQLAQAEKMESIGRLAAGVAHEVKNPLAVVMMGIDYLSQEDQPHSQGVSDVLRGMKNAVKRADMVVHGLLDFSAPSSLMTADHDLDAVIEKALALIKPQIAKSKVTLQKQWTPQLPAVRIDPNKIEQVFINLIMNAIQAMPAGGTLAMRTYAAVCPQGVEVLADVDDTGPGLAADVQSKLFEPFFTTKRSGEGSGLGLSVSRTIIDLHGGRIELSNRPEGGMRATIALRAVIS